MTRQATLIVSAPGKLFLIGEYAVLEGAPAILTAVNRRARVAMADSDDRQWHLTAPNLAIHQLALGTDGLAEPITDPVLNKRLSVFAAVCRHLQQQLDITLPAQDIHIDTSEFASDGYKLGLGSSAAVAAALTQALATRAGHRLERCQLNRMANTAHRNAQNGTGSGGDVATSIYGGLISYTRDQTPVPLTWPGDLTVKAVVTGKGASTTELVGRVYDYAQRASDAFDTDLAPLIALTHKAGHDIAQAGPFAHLANDYFEALQTLDRHAQAGIVSRRHHELHAIAAHYGAVFKSSGAGGGDVGLLFITPGVDEQALATDFRASKAEIIDLGFAAEGVTIDTDTGVA